MDTTSNVAMLEVCAAIESADNPDLELVQIGDLARRVGVRVDTLRAWERRYGLLHPSRSTGGFRLYSSDDESIVRSMLAEIDRGYPASQAAKLALAKSGTRGGRTAQPDPANTAATNTAETRAATDTPATTDTAGRLESLRTQLGEALRNYDGTRAQELFDAVLAEFTLNAVLRDVVLRCLSDIGDAWARGDMTVAEEHFASQLIRERLLALARDWGSGRGPRALLACPSGERHDIALICFGIVLSRNGWRVTFLGPDTPISALRGTVTAVEPDLIVLAATVEEWFISITSPLRALASDREVVIAGSGATPRVARATGATVLAGDPVAAALQIANR